MGWVIAMCLSLLAAWMIARVIDWIKYDCLGYPFSIKKLNRDLWFVKAERDAIMLQKSIDELSLRRN